MSGEASFAEWRYCSISAASMAIGIAEPSHLYKCVSIEK